MTGNDDLFVLKTLSNHLMDTPTTQRGADYMGTWATEWMLPILDN